MQYIFWFETDGSCSIFEIAENKNFQSQLIFNGKFLDCVDFIGKIVKKYPNGSIISYYNAYDKLCHSEFDEKKFIERFFNQERYFTIIFSFDAEILSLLKEKYILTE